MNTIKNLIKIKKATKENVLFGKSELHSYLSTIIKGCIAILVHYFEVYSYTRTVK